MKKYFKKGMVILGIVIWVILLPYSMVYYDERDIIQEETNKSTESTQDVEIPEVCKNLDLSKDELGKRMFGLFADEGEYAWAEKDCLVELDNPNIKTKGLELKIQTITGNLKHDKPELKPKVKLYINGIFLAEFDLFDECQVYKISKEKIPDVENNHFFIELECNASFIPSEIEESQDNRELAFQVFYIGEQQ